MYFKAQVDIDELADKISLYHGRRISYIEARHMAEYLAKQNIIVIKEK